MMNQTIFDTSLIFSKKGIKHVVLSPGSRNAPLTISFARNPDIKTYNIVDERSAGFIALGIAQKLNQPVVLCCTSGTSLLNYTPAIAEAYYQCIPLIVLSADRPSEWHGQRDGQTIHQIGSLSNFVRGTYKLPIPDNKDSEWEYTRLINEAINRSADRNSGPVHINVPFREPYYPTKDQQLEFSEEIKIIKREPPLSTLDFTALKPQWVNAKRVLIVAGQMPSNPFLSDSLISLSEKAVVVADVISNITGDIIIRHQDHFLANLDDKLAEDLKPDLLITLGKSVISKNLKLFLRKNLPKAHWHVEQTDGTPDTYQSLTHLLPCSPKGFLKIVIDNLGDLPKVEESFHNSWFQVESKTKVGLAKTLDKVLFCEYSAFNLVLKSLPSQIDLHLANSMPVRYANLLPRPNQSMEVFANRGTSGIDGTNGTAVGNALVSEKPTYLLTGDLSFFYDRNAFFHGYSLKKLKIIIFNNQGGGIFRLIGGPSILPELEQHFETRHSHTAKYTAAEYEMGYFTADDLKSIKESMTLLNKSKGAAILEIFTNPEKNSEVFKQVKAAIAAHLSA